MKPLLTALTLFSLVGGAAAQAHVFEPMPEGSQDVFLGLGLGHRPRYEGADARRLRAELLVQASWSNGLFVSGLQAGWHLSDALAPAWPRVEWGPLLNLQPPRGDNGRSWFADSLGPLSGAAVDPGLATGQRGNHLIGMDRISACVEAGGFVNLRATAQWRLSQSLLGGSGACSGGLRWGADVQLLWPALAAHHSLSATAGLGWANARFTQTYFGVTELEAARSRNPRYRPGGGVTEVRAQLRWNWLLQPDWVLSTALDYKRLQGPAARSPLVERAGAASLSTALVYRF
jgi:outer membrane scaffolding protein for murein synthesis (MipA/OmpV family)